MNAIISLDNLGLILSDLNDEVSYKAAENNPSLEGQSLLTLVSDGKTHRILFQKTVIWCSQLRQEMENLTPEQEMTLNERENFEKHLRVLINDHIGTLNNVSM